MQKSLLYGHTDRPNTIYSMVTTYSLLKLMLKLIATDYLLKNTGVACIDFNFGNYLNSEGTKHLWQSISTCGRR